MRFVLFVLAFMIVPPAFAAERGSVFERVLKERTLRCAYTIYPPLVAKDPNSGELGGLFYDLLEQMGKELGIKIVWAEEVGMDAIFSGLGSKRYDAVCAGYFSTPSRANGGAFTKPLVFMPTNLYVRAGESRFKQIADFNSPDVKIGTMDGEFSQIYKNQTLPLAGEFSLGGLSSAAERLEVVATGKADATIMEPAIAGEYMAHNPGKIEQFGDRPVHVGGSVIILPHGEEGLASYLNAAIDSMLYSGALEMIVHKHEKYSGSFLLPAQPYADAAE